MITNILINSSTSRIYTDGQNQNLYFNIDVPPLEIRNSAVLKVANFCHTGTATSHTENIYIFKIRGVNVNNSKYLYNIDGVPPILTTTFNNNRSLYEENEIVLTRQTINNIDILCDTLSTSGFLTGSYISNGGSSYLEGQILYLSGGGGSNGSLRITSVNSGVITSLEVFNQGSGYTTIPSISNVINGSGSVLTATILTGTINSVSIINAGIGYKVGQTLSFEGGGGSGANISIASVSGTGAILSFTITSGGSGYVSPPTTISVNTTTHTLTASIIPLMKFGLITNGIPNTLNFCMSLRIEQNIDD